MFLVREHEGVAGGRFYDGGGHVEEKPCAFGSGLGRGPDGEGQGLPGVGIEAEEGLDGFDGAFVRIMPVASGLAFGIAAHGVGVDGQQISGIVSAGPAQAAQGELEGLGLLDGMRLEQLMNGLVAGDEGQAVGELESFLAERASPAYAAGAQGGFVDQLEGQARGHLRAVPCAPSLEKVPRAQAQMFGDQEPNPHHGSRNLVGQKRAHAPFEAHPVARFLALLAPGALGFYTGPVRTEPMEFFFEGRIPR